MSGELDYPKTYLPPKPPPPGSSVPPIITGSTLIGVPDPSSPQRPWRPPPPPALSATRPPQGIPSTSATFHGLGTTAPPFVPPARWIGFELASKLFRLSTKFIPIAVMMGVGYASYSYFFRSVPVVESTLVALGAAPSAEVSPPAKAAQLVQQTRAVVAASESRVDFANSLAGPSLNAINLPEHLIIAQIDFEDMSAGAPPPSRPRTTSPEVSILDRLTMFEAERSVNTSASPSRRPALPTENIQRIISPIEPTTDFRRWAADLAVRGIRQGEITRVFINDLAIDIGDIVNHQLGITFEGLDEADTVLIFSDTTGALVTKFY